jgi:N-ethylmaleimide reductase
MLDMLAADFQPGGTAPISASAVPITDGSMAFTENGGPFPFPIPRALEAHEIPGVVQQFADAASNAIAAGFDGVEVRGVMRVGVVGW